MVVELESADSCASGKPRKLTLVVFLTNDLLISASMEVWTPCLDSPNASKRLLLPIFDRQEFATVRANP